VKARRLGTSEAAVCEITPVLLPALLAGMHSRTPFRRPIDRRRPMAVNHNTNDFPRTTNDSLPI
jgi:hypothetical protein